MIDVTIKISEVDYSGAVDVLMPVLLDKLSASSSPVMRILLEKLRGLSGPAAKAALEILPQETKDELAAACLNHYSADISKLMMDMARQKNIDIRLEGVEVAVRE